VFTSAVQGSWRAFLSGVEVESPRVTPVIVAFGDSITDGTASTEGANRRWPDRLAERLQGRAGIVNAGIAGNRVLADATPLFFGQSALMRFDRDVLSVPGATHLVILEGVNDLGQGGANPPSAEALIGGYRQLIARARAKGIKVIGATILPYEGARYFRAEGDAVRQQVNTWIRTGDEFDGVVDFEAAVRDPANPKRMRADYHSGDWLHPNDAGYRIMGDTVNLRLFR
jgi:lysophospholipase L1-like esterase